MSARRIALAVTTCTLAACSADPIAPASAPNEGPSLAVQTGTSTVLVTENDIARQAENTPPTKPWVLYVRNAGDGVFRVGPDNAPLGVGSHALTTPTGADKVTLFNFTHVDTPLSSVRAIAYSTFRTTGDAQQVAAINLQVDINGAAPDGFTTLVYEPVYNTDQGAVISGMWQSWDAYKGGNAIWWSSNPIPGAPNRDTFVSWSTILANNPDAMIVGGIGVNQGSGNPALATAVDEFVFGTTSGIRTYDFEPIVSPTTRTSCKDGGWQTLRRPDGSAFKNQGDCVSYVEAGR